MDRLSDALAVHPSERTGTVACINPRVAETWSCHSPDRCTFAVGCSKRHSVFTYDWSDQHPAARLVDPDLERNLQRASRVAALCTQLSQQGIQPDVVVFHSAWGLYLRDLAESGVDCELYAQAQLMGHGFDPDAGSLSSSRRALRRQILLRWRR